MAGQQGNHMHTSNGYWTPDAPALPAEELRASRRTWGQFALDMLGGFLAGALGGSVGFFVVAYFVCH
jgi:hypothetical protein